MEAPIQRLDEKFIERQKKLESLLTLGEGDYMNLMKVIGGGENMNA